MERRKRSCQFYSDRARDDILTIILWEIDYTQPPLSTYSRPPRYTFAASRSNGESFDLNMMTL